VKIGDVMLKLKSYEGALQITDPYALTCKRAYLYIPERSSATPEVDPFGFFNGWTLLYEKRLPNAQREHKYVIQIQGLAKEPSLDKASQIATSFFDQLMAVLDLHQTLEGTCTEQSLRGASPTLGRLEWAGVEFMGVNLLLDVVLRDPTTAGA